MGWWGDKRLSDVRRSSCEAYVAHRCAQPIAMATKSAKPRLVSSQGARRELEDLSAAIGYFSDEHPLTVRPKVSLPEKPESQRDALTRAQAARLLMAARGYRLHPTGALHPSGRPMWVRLRDSGPANRAHMKRFILIGLYTGTRPGVIPKLLWEESPTQAWVDLDKAMIWRRGKKEREHATKRRPVVKIPARLLQHMLRWKVQDEKVMERRAEAGLPTTNAVIHHGGRPIHGRPRKGFEGCAIDAGLGDGVTPHWQRHTAATWLMENGCDPWEAAGYLGMNLKTLLDNYGHHRPDHLAGAAKAITRR
jgi:integrase